MTKQEIIAQESTNTDKIILHLEGTFWIAYERSAHRFVESIRPYSVKKKFIKTAAQEIVYLGFPQSILPNLDLDIIEQTEKQITLNAPKTPTEEQFTLWKQSINYHTQEKPYNELQVYKATYDLLLHLFQSSKSMKREYKFTLGEEIKKDVVALSTDIFRACINQNKEPHIARAREKIEATKMRIRLLKDLRQISTKEIAQIAQQTETISKQLAAWHKTEKQKQGRVGVTDVTTPAREPDDFSSSLELLVPAIG